MANDTQLRIALKKTASVLANRELNEVETSHLVDAFNDAAGTNFERALKALTEATDLSGPEILKKSAASDNTNRVMDDLKEVVTNWKPGT